MQAPIVLQVRQDEAAQKSSEALCHPEIAQQPQAANSERVKQVVPAVQSQHETFK